MSSKQPAKKVSESAIHDHTHQVFPNDLNPYDTVFGGVVMAIIDRVAGVVAGRHSGQIVTTASVDALHFIAPAHKGENLVVTASVNRTWTTSMEIGLRVDAENCQKGERRHIVSAYLTFVAVDKHYRPYPVPAVIPETNIEKCRFEEAGHRREQRQAEASRRKKWRESNE